MLPKLASDLLPTSIAGLSAVPFQPSTMISPHAGAAAAYPDWALLNKTARFSDERNETSAECHTTEGHPVAVSFWLSDPPAVSHFTVHCPGLDAPDTPPYVICAEGAFVLFCVTLVDGSLHHFVYSAAGAEENPSLHLLPNPNPDPNVASFLTQDKFGLLPCGDEHYAVAFLDWQWPRDSRGETQYHACVFSSETNAWRRSNAAPLRLPESDKALFYTFAHGSYYKQITVGDSAVGWVDLTCGILLACNLFDETPVMRFIPFPASRACITYQYGDPYYARDVVCSGDLIRFVETDFDKPADRRTNSQGRRATTWNMKLDWDYWRMRCTVDVSDVPVDRSYSALLHELLDEETGELKLKKLDFIFPTLSVCNDNLLYMTTKVDQRDGTSWVVVVDMRRAVLEALVPVSTEPSDSVTPYCSSAFPRYYPADDTVETDDDSEDSDPMKGYRDWRQHWCEQSLASWDFSEEEDEHGRKDPAEKEEGDADEEDLVKSQEEDDCDDDPVIGEEEECQAMESFFCHKTKTNAGADMSNPMDNHDKSNEKQQRGLDLDDNKHQQKKKKRRKRTRSSRRKKKKKQAQAQAQAQVPDPVTGLLDLLLLVCCILVAIICIKAFPG